MMIEGFVGGFAIGFLATAMPKMLSTPPFRLWQVLALATLYIGSCTSHFVGSVKVGDGLFAATLILLLGCLAIRVKNATSTPPPSMILAAMGLFCGLFGSVWSAFFVPSEHFYLTLFSQRLLFQAFILLPILGVGGFFFPMVFETQKTSEKGKHVWRNKALYSGALGLLIILTYWVEVHGQARAMSASRFILCLIWLSLECGWLRKSPAKGVITIGLRAGIACVLLGIAATSIFQQQRVALEHTLYIGGFCLITMMVAARVIFGHSGQANQFHKWGRLLTVCVLLVLLTMATRISADFLPGLRVSHHIYAAFCWVIVSIIWGLALLPSIRKQPVPKPIASTPPKARSVLDMDFRKK